MSRFLFDTLIVINGFLALIIILIMGSAGWLHPYFAQARPVGLIIGALVGIVCAAILCGTIAFLALIERHLRAIAETRSHGPAPIPSLGRQEPHL